MSALQDFNIQLTITGDDVDNLLCSAFESGGSAYWAGAEEGRKPTSKADYLHEWPLRGGSVIIIDNEGDGKKYTLDRAAIVRGLNVMAKLKEGEGGHHFANIIKGDTDAETGDVLVQCAIFGEIVYG